MKAARPASRIREGWSTPGAFADSTETAEFLGVERSTAQRWAREGTLSATRLGGTRGVLRFRKLDVERWASRQPKASA